MTKKIETLKAPKAIGPYSQAMDTGTYVLCSGQVPIDPVSGEMTGDDIQGQTTQVLKNVKALCEAAGLSPKNIVKSTVFLSDMAHFAAFNEIYESFFKAEGVSHYPARSTVAVRELPRKSLVEIEVILCRS